MEFAAALVGSVTEPIRNVSIRHLGYIIRYKRHVKELKQRVDDLEIQRQTVQREVSDAEKNVQEIKANVKDWLEKVDTEIKKSQDFYDEAATKTGCSRGILSFLRNRHKQGKQAKEMAAYVLELRKDGSTFGGVSHPPTQTPAVTALSNDGYVKLQSRQNTMEKIMEQLKDSTVRMIGVHGPGGVGKTALVKEIAKEAKGNKLFDVVVMLDITRNPNRQEIQQEIAYSLGLTFEREGGNVRADRLRSRLKQAKENILVILDDLWDEFDLNMLGIIFDDDDLGHMTVQYEKDNLGHKMARKEKSPGDYDGKSRATFDDRVKDEKDFSYKMVNNEDSPGVYKGCKILLTSRIKEVLSDKMNVNENSIFHVTELNNEEVETLFNNVVEISDENSKFKLDLVKKYCAGLPMAIRTVGRALRNESESVWEDALKKHKQELMGMHKPMEISVRMSYDHLESEELKSIFLLCAQMGQQPLIVDLVKYCFGLGILKGVHTLTDARDRISKLIQKLKDSSLISDGNSSNHFNMHDMVQDAALSIAHKDLNVFTLRNNKLDDWPDKDELEKCTSISIYKSDIVDELPEVINCPQLKVFHIDNDDPNLKIPDRFFEGMKKLRVLILTGIHLQSLPSSIKCLPNLRMLCLERCILHNLSIIGDLKKLRILSLSGSKIEDWPTELGGLSKLQLLDISDCSIANLIPPNFVSSLTSLEELYIRKSLTKMEEKEERNQSQISVLSELKHLHQLKIIDVCISGAEVLPVDVFFDKLSDYKIVIGDFKMLSIGDFKMPNKYEASRSLALQLKAGTNIHSLKGVKMLFKRVENLLLAELNGVQNAFYELNLGGFPDLKNLSIINNDIEYIVNSMEMSHPQDAFPNLESLSLFNLEKIKKICCSLVTDTSFSRLRTIKVKKCAQLKNLFSFYIVKFLTSLETIDVSDCVSLEEIAIEEGEVFDKVEFPRLCFLTLQELPSFISFYTNNKMLSAPQFMDRQARNTEIAPAEDEQSVTTSLSLFDEKVEIPNLESLKLSSISIHKIWSDQLSSLCFENLIKLTVEDCCYLTYLCSLSVASSLKKLKALFLSECRKMEKLFTPEGDSNDYSEVCIFPMLEEIQLTNMDMLKDIWPAEVSAKSFPSLISVHIEGCKKLEKIFPSHMESWYRSLDSLKVIRCDSVEVIFEVGYPLEKDAVDTKLQLILLRGLNNLKQVWSRDPEGVVNFKNLRSLKVINSDKLSNVLPASVAKGLAKLEEFSIHLCKEMEEIVAWVAGSETSNEPLMFPEVTSMAFYNLRNIRRFYVGRHPIECPKLKQLMVNNCPQLETFTTESTNEEERPVFLAEKVISNLEYLDISPKEAEWLKSNIGKYRMHRLKILRLLSVPSVETLYWFLHRIPNLERLHLGSPKIRELVPSGNTAPHQNLGTVLQLRELAFYTSSIGDIGFERDPILQRIERLVLSRCSNLINLAHSSVSLTHLTCLEVYGCFRLKNLMSSSTAKSLVQLTTMKVIGCDNLKEIVTNDEGNEEKRMADIVFGKLITIELVTLKNLTSFCSYKNCQFSFPSLEKLILRDCLKMKTFAESHVRAPKLQDVLAVEGKEEGKWHWEGDLNATLRKVFADKVSFEYTSRLELSGYPELEQVWCGTDLMHENSFRNLKTLVVENCGYLVHVIPSHLLPCFKNLEELVVGSCDAVQAIFNINDNRVTKASGMFHVRKLTLRDLPKLEHVWDKDPEGIIGLHDLQDLSVYKCQSLKYVFPASVAKDLGTFRKLSVVDCQQLVEIFAEDEKASEGDAKSLEFRSLTSLELRMLPELKYFYPGLHMQESPELKELYIENYVEEQALILVEKVDIPNLESLNLSSVYIHKIWNDQPSGSWFQNLVKLIVKDCSKLTYLCSLSVAQSLNKLKGLFVSECRMMEKLFNPETNSNELSKVCIFPKLEEIELTNMEMLKDIWPAEVNADSFPSLISVHIARCKKLGKIFSSHIEGWYRSLDSLKIVHCESVEVIFDINCPQQNDEIRLSSHLDVRSTKLQLIHLQGLQNLKQVWSRDPEGVVNFTNLRTIRVLSCPKLSNVLPNSVAKGLAKLEVLSISSCNEMEEIVAWVAGSETNNEPLVFPEVTSMSFNKLKNIRHFYMGRHTVECPKLKRLTVNECPKLETFTTESTNEEERPVFSAEKVISNLECLDISRKEAEWLKSNIGKYRMHHLKVLRLLSVPSVEILHCFLNSVPNLETLHTASPDIREVVPSGNTAPQQRLGTVLQLRELGLYTSSIGDIGFERAPILQRIERLILSNCHRLINLAHSSVCLTNLTYLEVRRCGVLKNLMSSSTAKSLVQLTTVKVIQCDKLKEIVTNDEGNEEKRIADIVFGKLITIELVTLKTLTTFCSYKNCQFSFPSLEKLILRDWPKMKTFAESHARAPKLQDVLAVEGKEEEKWHWEGDLNATIRKVFADKDSFKYASCLELSGYPELEQVWCGTDLVQENSFRNLKTLVVKNCDYLVHVIPSHLLPSFKNLEELAVGSCDAVQVIFNINDNRLAEASGFFRLKKLSLGDLPKLEHVWDKDPEGIIFLQALQDLSVNECYSLKYVFPASVAKDLAMLQRLSVRNCKQLVEFFAEDETASEGDTKSLVFRSLTSLELRTLPELRYFYPGLHMLEFPVLSELYIEPSKWMILNCQEAEAYLEEQVLIPVEKVNLLMQSLEKLSFDMRDAKVTWDLKPQKLELENLLQLQDQSDSVLYRFLQMVPDVEKLEVKTSSSLEEMFSEDRPDADYVGVLSHLKGLRLSSLFRLKSIGLEHSWILPIPENLQTLEVEKCHNLNNLVPCTVSFSILTNLVVSECNDLLFLFTLSTAKSLARLKQMEIRGCPSMQEIVSKEGDESDEDEKIIFGQLQALYLEGLPRLRCFYSGNYTLCFPSLEEVSITNCLLIKAFCPRIIINQGSVKLLTGIGLVKDVTQWDSDLDTTISKTNEKNIAKQARDIQYLTLGGRAIFQEMWHGSMSIPDASFSNLESLVVKGCEFLSEVLPANLLPFLYRMQKLEVRNCSSVKTIFDVKCITEDKKMTMGPALLPLPFSLKKLVLVKLPNLESVWNGDPDGVLSVHLLQEVHVDTCQCLKSLFPTSIAKDLVKLENLEVKHCGSLVEIVAGIEAAPGGTNLDFTFPCLTSLTLLDLPKVKCFYCSLYCVEFTGQDPHIEDQVCLKEVTPNLANLSLDEKELKMIWHGQCQGDHFHKIKVLDLQCFNVESSELPCGFIEKVPNIEKLVVSNSSFKEIFCSERLNLGYAGFLSQLKALKLASLHELISIGLEHSWIEESFLKNLETLEAKSCSRLRNLVPSSICFSSLMHLTVSNCDDMIHLFTSSTAKSLAQLKEMDISSCRSLQEILSKKEDESHQDEIIFGQLQMLILRDLSDLRSFYKGSFTLSFSSLEQLSVINCHRMDTFCAGTVKADKLSAVEFNSDGVATPLKVDLNFSIHRAFEAHLAKFVRKVKDSKLSDHPEVHEIWHGSFPVPFLCFTNLKSLIVQGCEFLSNVIPSHILGSLCNLEELAVRQCNSVKVRFEVKDVAKDTGKFNLGSTFSLSFRLRKLTFAQLPNLEHVCDSISQEVISLQTLQEVYVHECDSLERLFPASVAKTLVPLEKLEVQQCGRLVEIVANDEAATDGVPIEFVLPNMTSIKLSFVPELKCFYPGPHKLECPKLKEVNLFHCGKLNTFTCESQSLQEAELQNQVVIPLYKQALFLAEKVIPYLEIMALSKEEATMIWHGQFHVNLLHKLQALQLQCFHDVSDTFPYGLLQKVPNIEKLIVSCTSFKEIFRSERPNMDCAEEILSHLKYLQLSSLSELNSIGLEHSWMDLISENLEKLQVVQCHCLRNIVPYKVSFSSLIDLNISKCGGLVHLFTPSTSRTLCQLKNMSVKDCESLEEIVSEEVDESSKHDEEEIIFHKLKTLSLNSLPRLGRFYNGSVALSFPSLDQLSLIDCRRMESFCAGAVSANKWTKVKFKTNKVAVPLEVDLNSSVWKAFEATV